jgi:uncharacterized protein YggE
MAGKPRERGGGTPPARSNTEAQSPATREDAGSEAPKEKTMREETKAMSPSEIQGAAQPRRAQPEGVTVIGEAVRRVAPERAEFIAEITTSAPNAAQALRENHTKTTQLAQAVSTLGVLQADIQSISLNMYSLYAPLMQALPPYAGGAAQIGPGFPPYSGGPAMTPGLQPEVQFGAYHARNTLRIQVREPGRVGEVADAVSRTGATVAGGFAFQVSDESHARRAALDAAAKDARSKAEALAAAAGRQIGDLVSITEDVVASNGDYAALRSAFPFSFGAGAPRAVGELEYYARVSANFRIQQSGITGER